MKWKNRIVDEQKFKKILKKFPNSVVNFSYPFRWFKDSKGRLIMMKEPYRNFNELIIQYYQTKESSALVQLKQILEGMVSIRIRNIDYDSRNKLFRIWFNSLSDWGKFCYETNLLDYFPFEALLYQSRFKEPTKGE